MADLSNLTIKKTQNLIKNKEVSVKELTDFYLNNIKKKNKEINAILEVFDDMEVESQGLLTGIHFTIKDNILIEGKIASAGSKILENYRASYSAAVIKN